MAKKGRRVFERGSRRLYLGEWLSRLGRKPHELAAAVHVTEQYVSELISAKKDNPGIALLLKISEWLGITVNDLFTPPPPRSSVEAVERLSPSQMATLGHLLDEMKPKPRK